MYQKMLNLNNAENGSMGSLQIPKISVSLPTYHGTSDEVLENGVGTVVLYSCLVVEKRANERWDELKSSDKEDPANKD